MFCTQCGSEIEEHARFCSKCGHVATQKSLRDMELHINILGWLLIGSGILTGIVALIILFGGQVIRHLPIPWPPDVPVGMPHFIAWITTMVGMGAMALAAGVAAAGVGLLQYRTWARVLAIIMAFFMLFHFPLGTAIAAYAFWVLFSQEGQEYYKSRSASTMTMSGT